MSRKVAFIGGGSAKFVSGLVRDLFTFEELADSQICLMDIDAHRLDRSTRLVQKIIEDRKLPATVEATTDQRRAVDGADYVIVTIMVGGLKHYESDGTIPGDRLRLDEVLQAGHHALLAHGRAVQVIRANAARPPTIGFAPVGVTCMPATDTPADIDAARDAMFAVRQPDCFIREMLIPLRTVKPQALADLPPNVSDVRFHRVWANGRNGVRIRGCAGSRAED